MLHLRNRYMKSKSAFLESPDVKTTPELPGSTKKRLLIGPFHRWQQCPPLIAGKYCAPAASVDLFRTERQNTLSVPHPLRPLRPTLRADQRQCRSAPVPVKLAVRVFRYQLFFLLRNI